MSIPSRGFTIVEAVAALLLLGVGVIATAGGAGAAGRMLGQGRRRAAAAILASGRLDRLRAVAGGTRPRCAAAAFSGGTACTDGVRETWLVAPAGAARLVRDVVEYAGPAGTARDTITTIVQCPR